MACSSPVVRTCPPFPVIGWRARYRRAHKVLACPAIRLRLMSRPLATNPGVSVSRHWSISEDDGRVLSDNALCCHASIRVGASRFWSRVGERRGTIRCMGPTRWNDAAGRLGPKRYRRVPPVWANAGALTRLTSVAHGEPARESQ